VTINRQTFFRSIRPTPLNVPRLLQSQVDTLDAILDEYEKRTIPLWFPAYMMATALGETGIKLAPVREGFSKTDDAARAYVKRKRYRYAKPAGPYGLVYYGRGLVQVTWFDNYEKLTKIAQSQGIDVDFVKNPALLLEPKWAVWAMVEGMTRGTFTGRKLSDYFTGTRSDPLHARQIINAMDRAAEIAGYAKQFYADLISSDE
jgi:putative chitinase